MELVALHQRVVGLDIHQAQITACALLLSVISQFDGPMVEFGDVAVAQGDHGRGGGG